MTLHVPALPSGVEPDVADAAAQEAAGRRRQRADNALTFSATVIAVLVIAAANVALELLR